MSMFPFSFFGCFGILVMVAVIAECARAIWTSLVMPARPREAECGGCGYQVAGLSSMMCPECGKDLRIAGINTRALVLRHRGSTAGAVVAWTMLCVLFGIFGVGVFGVRIATQARASSAMSARAAMATPQTWTTALVPKSGVFKDVDVEVTTVWGSGGGGNTLRGLKATLTNNAGEVWMLDHDPSNGSLQIVGPDGKQGTPVAAIGSGVADELFRAAGVKAPAGSSLATEATELEDVLRVVTMAPTTQVSQMNVTVYRIGSPRFSGGATRPPPMVTPPSDVGWIVGGAIGAVVLGWLMGVVGIVVRRRRLAAEAAGMSSKA